MNEKKESCCFKILSISMATLLLAIVGQCAAAEVVYDSLSGTLFGGGNGFNNSTDIGQAIALSGTERKVTLFEYRLGATASDDYHVRFYDLDGSGGEPGTLIWQSPVLTYPFTPPFANRKTLALSVPGIVVPSAFAWAVTPVGTNGLLVGNTAPPTVGSMQERWLRSSVDGTWSSLTSSTFGFGARVTDVQVPEPSSVAMGVLAFLLLVSCRSNLRDPHAL